MNKIHQLQVEKKSEKKEKLRTGDNRRTTGGCKPLLFAMIKWLQNGGSWLNTVCDSVFICVCVCGGGVCMWHTLESRVLWPWRKTVVCLLLCVCGLNFTFLFAALEKVVRFSSLTLSRVKLLSRKGCRSLQGTWKLMLHRNVEKVIMGHKKTTS